jgi:microcystin-dependent protein
MLSTTRLTLNYPQGTDDPNGFPAVAAQAMGVLDAAALTEQGTLSSRPAASTVVTGFVYVCTDIPAAFVSVTISGTKSWQFIALGGSAELVGTIKQYAGSTVPADADGVQRWHLADGSAISRTMYPTYYSNVGTLWGTGDGSTTVNVPDLRGVTLVGGATVTNPHIATTARAVTSYGGEEAHVLSVGELATHSHTDSGHQHTFSGFNIPASNADWPYEEGALGTGGSFGAFPYVGPDFDNTQLSGTASGTANLESTGSGTGHNNMQPFAVVSHIVKIA